MRADRLDGVRAGARRGAGRGVRRDVGPTRWSAVGPGWTRASATAALLARRRGALGRPIVGVPRGGASDASHFASAIPLTVDGLGPRGGGAHTPEEFVLARSLRERAEVALALAVEAVLGPQAIAAEAERTLR